MAWYDVPATTPRWTSSSSTHRSGSGRRRRRYKPDPVRSGRIERRAARHAHRPGKRHARGDRAARRGEPGAALRGTDPAERRPRRRHRPPLRAVVRAGRGREPLGAGHRRPRRRRARDRGARPRALPARALRPAYAAPEPQLFLDEFGRELARAERHGDRPALLFIDLAGSRRSTTRSSTPPGTRSSCSPPTVCARACGNPTCSPASPATSSRSSCRSSATSRTRTVAQHLIETLSQPYRIGHGDTFIAASVGIAVYPGDGSGATELLQHADMAMYRAKQQGRGNHVFLESAMNHEAQRRMVLDRELRHALQAGEFVLYYQPQFDLRQPHRRRRSVVRWLHLARRMSRPVRSSASPRRPGSSRESAPWVLAEASAQFMAWRVDGLPLDYISVNVSPRQFRRPDFAESVAAVVRRSGIDPQRLHLEITESVLVDDAAADAMLTQLTALGTPLPVTVPATESVRSRPESHQSGLRASRPSRARSALSSSIRNSTR